MNTYLLRLAALLLLVSAGACAAQNTPPSAATMKLLTRFAPRAPFPGERAIAIDSSYVFARGMGYTFRIAQPQFGFSDGVVRADVGETEHASGEDHVTRSVMLVSDSVQFVDALRVQLDSSIRRSGREGCSTTAGAADRVWVWHDESGGVALMAPSAPSTRSNPSMALLFFKGDWEHGAFIRQFRWGSC